MLWRDKLEIAVKLILSESDLRTGVERMAQQISTFYDGKPITIVGILTGSMVLLADLIRQLEMPLRIGLVQARSYRGKSVQPGPLVVHAESLPELAGQHAVLVDDIFDTGRTLVALSQQIEELAPASLRSAVLLRKRGRQQVSYVPDWIGFDIPDEFVVGYGLDYDDLYRNLPYLAALEPADLEVREVSA